MIYAGRKNFAKKTPSGEWFLTQMFFQIGQSLRVKQLSNFQKLFTNQDRLQSLNHFQAASQLGDVCQAMRKTSCAESLRLKRWRSAPGRCCRLSILHRSRSFRTLRAVCRLSPALVRLWRKWRREGKVFDMNGSENELIMCMTPTEQGCCYSVVTRFFIWSNYHSLRVV